MGYFTNRNDIPRYANLFEESDNMRSYILTTDIHSDNLGAGNNPNTNNVNENNQANNFESNLLPIIEQTLNDNHNEHNINEDQRDHDEVLPTPLSQNLHESENGTINILDYIEEDIYSDSFENQILQRYRLNNHIDYSLSDLYEIPNDLRIQSIYQDSSTRRNDLFMIDRNNIEIANNSNENQPSNSSDPNNNENQITQNTENQSQNSNEIISKQH